MIKIKNHVSKMKIKGWELSKNMRSQGAKIIYKGIADGKPFCVESNGHMRIGDIINEICKAVQK